MSVKAREEVRKLPENEDHPVLILELDNGDRKAFNEIQEKFNLKDEQSVLRFAMGVLLNAQDGTISITITASGEEARPSKDYLK